MEIIDRENEFTKLRWEKEGYLHTFVKSKFLKFGFNYYMGTKLLSSEPFESSIPITDIKKLKIQGTKPITWIFYIFAALSFGLGFLNGHDSFTGQSIPAPSGNIAIGAVIAGMLVLLGILFGRSKTGRLNYLFTNFKGTPVVIYGSMDINELISLRQQIESKLSPK